MCASTPTLDAQLFDFGTSAPITAAQLPRHQTGDDFPGSPYLVRESRFIALSRALRHLSPQALDSQVARAGAYLAAGLLDCTVDEDTEALRRQRTYWRCIKQAVGAPPSSVCRLEIAPIDQVLA